jgi:hypothetical protein
MVQNKLLGKKILYIGLDYFGYPAEIKKEMEKAGGSVRYFPIYPSGNKIKILSRISEKMKNAELDRYYSSLFNDKNDYDYLFFITVHRISLNLMSRLKNKFKDAIFILYNWDSLKTHDYLPYVSYFDRVLSFDREDCTKHSNIDYLPLFFTAHYESLRNLPIKKINKPQLVFIGCYYNMRRYTLVRETEKLCKKLNIDFFHHLYINKLGYFRICLENRKILNPKFFKFRKLSLEEITNRFNAATCIIDLPNNYQNGITMRVIETLGAHKKIITTNRNIINEPVYNEKIISIIDGNEISLDTDFIKNDVQANDFQGVDKYSLRNWISTIFKLDEKVII